MNADDKVREYRKRQAPDTPLDGAISMQYADAAIAALEAELEHALSWPGLLEFIDETYPADIFTGESGDPGPRLIVLLRELKKAEAELAEARAAITELATIARRKHFVLDDDCWYSCPASGRCCRDDDNKRCNCGADRVNARIDEILATQKEESP